MKRRLLRLRMAWAILRGRSVAYRVNATVYYGHARMFLRGPGFMTECWVYDEAFQIHDNTFDTNTGSWA